MNNSYFVLAALVVLCILLVIEGYLVYKLLKTNRKQKQEIQKLNQRVFEKFETNDTELLETKSTENITEC